MNLVEIGTIVRLQIQRKGLKVGQKPYRIYDPSPILSVDRLRVTPKGAQALLLNDDTAIDVHHVDHPDSKNAGDNSISIGFAANYKKMRDRFGDHMFIGCAGENILIETDRPIGPGVLSRGLAFRLGSSDDYLWLGQIKVALPCVEFSRYSSQMPQAERDTAVIKETLQFLDGGLRGYYTLPTNSDQPLVVSVGDRVYLPE
ncbi:MAG TPA: hypothetical protein VFF70_02455 [Anaerolineae bacterium]|nr:hypothetical protein [Anaerolineae bacterium]